MQSHGVVELLFTFVTIKLPDIDILRPSSWP